MSNSKIFTFKTIVGDTLLGEIHSIDDKRKILNVVYPLKILLIPTQTPDGLFTQHIPSLYQPYGITNVIPFKEEFFTSILPCSDFDARYYESSLEMLIYTETKRLIFTDRAMYEKEYADKYIMNTHATVQ